MADARCSETAGNGRVADTQTTCDAGDRTVAQQRVLQEGGAFHTGCAYALQFSSVGHNVPVRRRYVLSHLANAHAENSMVRN
ncbi:hypothetical protein XAPC_2208 [Xanthomonas citri pv. punicae str. LMG 859]|nr:hypothetical protein XAPC_2208 [Xanthomonas citri pv. punicae str. LMG 859]